MIKQFIYFDTEKINSLAAQMWEGIEESLQFSEQYSSTSGQENETTKGTDFGGETGIPVAKFKVNKDSSNHIR